MNKAKRNCNISKDRRLPSREGKTRRKQKRRKCYRKQILIRRENGRSEAAIMVCMFDWVLQEKEHKKQVKKMNNPRLKQMKVRMQ